MLEDRIVVSKVSKTMGSEWSVMFISSLLLLNFLLLCQLGTGANNDINAAGDQESGFNTTSGNLTESDAQALQSLFIWLNYKESYSNCSTEKGAEIRCGRCDKNNNSCSITEINLSRKNLEGYIYPYISEGDFKYLRVLDLSGNQLSGEIPSSLEILQSLEILDLSYNSLTGSIPDNLTTLGHLEELDLSYNDLDGNIPNNLTGQQSLRYLYLYGNKLTGTVPVSISDCKKLTGIYLHHNFLNGSIPKTMDRISSLEYLYLYNNSLSGHIPETLGNLTALTSLDLGENNLEGEIPPQLGHLVNLTVLRLNSNKLTGGIPDKLLELANLETFSVGGNYLSGSIPQSIGKWRNLTELNLIGNNFEGNLPPETFNLTNLEKLWVSDVSLPGISLPEPDHQVIPKSLSSVVLRNCSITGEIPKYIGNWTRLSYLDLSFNNLSGGIPESFQTLTNKSWNDGNDVFTKTLQKAAYSFLGSSDDTSFTLILTNNMLSDLPGWITKKQNLSDSTKIDLSYNNFVMPCENMTCLGLDNVNIYPTRGFIDEMKGKCHRKHNSLFINCGGQGITVGKDRYRNDTATSSFYHSQSENWAYSSSGQNVLEVETNASTSIRNLTCEVSNAEAKLDNNFRVAQVSLTYYGLCLENGKYFVTLLFSEPSTSNGEDYTRKGKRLFDVYIQGKLEQKDLNITDIRGEENEAKKRKFNTTVQKGFLEITLFWAGKGSLDDSPVNGPLISAISITRVPRKLHPWEIALITVGCILFLLLLLAFMWRMGWIGDKEFRETKVEIRERSFTLKKIIDATNKFKNEIGSGRFGVVCKAELPNLTVAVKKLSLQSKQVKEIIASEMYAMNKLNLQHENLVQLLTTCSKRNLHLLIYEYMELGSLGQVLFGTTSTERLDWPKSFGICRGIAMGLKYLHERSPPIIHRNLKATNILLDANCTPKISDFGLAKLYEEEDPFNMIGDEGDRIYMSPELQTRKGMTVKVDVYSFGILLLEIVSGRAKADYRANQEAVFLPDLAGTLHAKGRLADLVDARLRPYVWEEVNIVLNLAMMCIDQFTSLRPTMSQVVAVLEREKTIEDISNEISTPSS